MYAKRLRVRKICLHKALIFKYTQSVCKIYSTICGLKILQYADLQPCTQVYASARSQMCLARF